MNDLISITPKDPARVAAAVAGTQADAKALFHPVEHALLRQFFGLRALKGSPADLSQPLNDGDEEEITPPYIGIDSRLESYGLENAVARLCLGAIQHRLPQWGCVNKDGTVLLNRKDYARVAHAVEAKPVFLFELNWADSGPGYSWPTSYYATFIPGYARWVVTASADGPDFWGCADIAIGHFRGQDIRAGAGRVVRSEWRKGFKEYDQSPWAYLFSDGLISTEEAFAWRKRVWGRRVDEVD